MNGTLTLNCLKNVGKDNSENMFFSPPNIFSARAMVLPGAKGNGAAPAHGPGHCPEVKAEAEGRLPARVSDRFSPSSRGWRAAGLSTANSLLGGKACDFHSPFKGSCRRLSQAEVEKLDFFRAPKDTREHINPWVANEAGTEAAVSKFSPSTYSSGSREAV